MLLPSLSAKGENWDISYAPVVVYHDPTNESSMALIYVNKLYNLLGHFRVDIDIRDVTSYTSGDLDSYRAAFYMGTHFDQALPDAFLTDVANATTPVVWFRRNIWKLLNSTNDTSRLDLTYHDSTNGYDTVSYKGEWLFKSEQSSATFVSTNGGNAEVLSHMSSRATPSLPEIPYVVHSADYFWYIAGNPFSWQVQAGAQVVVADLLHDILGTGIQATNHRALIRIEDVAPGYTTWREGTLAIATELAALGVPVTLGVVPRYIDDAASKDVPISTDPAFLDALRQVTRLNGTLLSHGYTHQRGTQKSIAGYEFWDDDLGQPLAEDDWDWASARVESGANELMRSGFPVEIWETPHYSASIVDYHVFADRYDMIFEDISVSSHLTDGLSRTELETLSASDPSKSGQELPYVSHNSSYGASLLPENLGRYSLGSIDGNGLERTVSNKAVYASKQRVVRDAVACAYYHPSKGTDPATNIAVQLMALGYTFVTPRELYEEEPVPVMPVTGSLDSGIGRSWVGITSNRAVDVVVGESGQGNHLIISSGSRIANRAFYTGRKASSGLNSTALSGTSTLWQCEGPVVVGRNGDGNNLSLTSGSSLVCERGVIGKSASARGNMAVVSGLGSLWSNHFGLAVGDSGTFNHLLVENGGSVCSMFGSLGRNAGAAGNTATVNGGGSTWSNATYLIVGERAGNNRLIIENAGHVDSRYGYIGLINSGSSNAVVIDGTASQWRVEADLTVGVDGKASTLLLTDGGSLHACNVTVGLTSNACDSVLTVSGGDLYISNRLHVAHGTVVLDHGTSVVGSVEMGVDGRLAGEGTIQLTGDFRASATNAGNEMLDTSLRFSTGSHVLETGAEDRGRSLSGFGNNAALGELHTEGTVNVVGPAYIWSLSGTGTVSLAGGDRLYYMDASGWSGNVVLGGDAVFMKVDPQITNIVLNVTGNPELTWPSGEGLVFCIEWTADLISGIYQTATNLIGGGSSSTWFDKGITNIPSTDPARFYRLTVSRP